jgi:hypothetical protein
MPDNSFVKLGDTLRFKGKYNWAGDIGKSIGLCGVEITWECSIF